MLSKEYYFNTFTIKVNTCWAVTVVPDTPTEYHLICFKHRYSAYHQWFMQQPVTGSFGLILSPMMALVDQEQNVPD